MPEIPNGLTWLLGLATLVSLIFNIWQWQDKRSRDDTLRHLLPTWCGWAEEIRMQTSETHLNHGMNTPNRLVAATTIIRNANGHAQKLAQDIDRIADDYRSKDDLAKKRPTASRRRRKPQRSQHENRKVSS